MKSLNYIKQEYAMALGYPSWRDLVNDNEMRVIDYHYDEVDKLYAKEAVRELAEQVLKDFPLDEQK